MKIVDLQVIPFRVRRRDFRNGAMQPETEVTQTLTKVSTDEGVAGYYLGGRGHGDQDGLSPDQRAMLEGRIKTLIVGQDPFDREKFWHWLWVANLEENLISVLDMALWDLQALCVWRAGLQVAGRLPRQGQGLRQHLSQHGHARRVRPTCLSVQGPRLYPLQDPSLLFLGPGHETARPGPAFPHRTGHRSLPRRARGRG